MRIKKKLAICIPTYNRPGILSLKLWREAEYYNKFDIDVYVFDSSTDNLTQSVTENPYSKINNLYYVRIDSAIHSNLKAYMVEGDYSYVWLCSDSVTWNGSVFEEVEKSISNDRYDFLILNYKDIDILGNREYNNKDTFFQDCCWFMTLFGGTIVKSGTVLSDVPWEYLKKKYCVKNKINFSHLGLYFERLKSLSGFRAKHLSIPPEGVFLNGLGGHSGWYNDAFQLWLDYWPSAVYAFPDCYTQKDDVIRKHNKYSGVFDKGSLIGYRINNVLNSSIRDKYRNEMVKYADFAYRDFICYSYYPSILLRLKKKGNVFRNYIHGQNIKRWLLEFCRAHADLYLCGNCDYTKIIHRIIKSNNIKIMGYIKTPFDMADDQYDTYENVYYLKDFNIKNDNCGIILGMDFPYYSFMKNGGAFEHIEIKHLFSEFLYHRKGFKSYREN